MNRDEIVKIARLTGCQNFIGKSLYSMRSFNFVDLKPVERSENGSDMICDDLGALTTARAREF